MLLAARTNPASDHSLVRAPRHSARVWARRPCEASFSVDQMIEALMKSLEAQPSAQ